VVGRGGKIRINEMRQINNLKPLKAHRRQLRAALTPAEARLWKYLKSSQLDGRKFRRQHSVGPYILDFYCPALKLAVELDGAAHDSDTAQLHDERRSRFLAGNGIRVLRFQNNDVINNPEGVLSEIRRHIQATP
jgi:very-short-patch-repair endonuclease